MASTPVTLNFSKINLILYLQIYNQTSLGPISNCVMKKKPKLHPKTFAFILVVAVLLYFWMQHQKIERLQQIADQQKKSNWDLQLAFFQASHAYKQQTELVNELVRRNPPKDASTLLIIKDLNELAELFTPSLPRMAIEMESACKLFSADQLLNSAATMAKIMENMLKGWFLKDEDFKKQFKKKTVNFGNFISYIEDKKLFPPADITFLKEFKGLRNEAVHDIDVRKPKAYLISFHRKCIDLIKRNVSRFALAE